MAQKVLKLYEYLKKEGNIWLCGRIIVEVLPLLLLLVNSLKNAGTVLPQIHLPVLNSRLLTNSW